MNPPAGSPDLLEPAGPTDPTVSYIALREPGASDKMIALFAAYSLHYVGGVGEGRFLSDYFGCFCNTLERLASQPTIDPPFVAMMANGTSGDVNNINFRNPRGRREPYEQMRYVADDVAQKVHSSFATLQWKSEAKLAAVYRELDLKWRVVDEELMNWVQETEAKVPKSLSANDLGPIYAGRVKRLANASPQTKTPVKFSASGMSALGPARVRPSLKRGSSSNNVARSRAPSWSNSLTAITAICLPPGTSSLAATKHGPEQTT